MTREDCSQQRICAIRKISFFILLLFFLNLVTEVPLLAEEASWAEVLESSEGRQWWDKESLRRNTSGHLTIKTKYKPFTVNDAEENRTISYTMEIDCPRSLYRDKVVNGITQLKPKWSSAKNDLLITSVINDVCVNCDCKNCNCGTSCNCTCCNC